MSVASIHVSRADDFSNDDLVSAGYPRTLSYTASAAEASGDPDFSFLPPSNLEIDVSVQEFEDYLVAREAEGYYTYYVDNIELGAKGLDYTYPLWSQPEVRSAQANIRNASRLYKVAKNLLGGKLLGGYNYLPSAVWDSSKGDENERQGVLDKRLLSDFGRPDVIMRAS